MIASGMATVQYQCTFVEQRIGMMLADAEDGGVEVVAFTELDGQLGPAELSGKVAVGDQITRVNGRSTRTLDYRAVLDMVIAAERPVTIHFERRGTSPPEPSVRREQHTDWQSRAAPPSE